MCVCVCVCEYKCIPIYYICTCAGIIFRGHVLLSSTRVLAHVSYSCLHTRHALSAACQPDSGGGEVQGVHPVHDLGVLQALPDAVHLLPVLPRACRHIGSRSRRQDGAACVTRQPEAPAAASSAQYRSCAFVRSITRVHIQINLIRTDDLRGVRTQAQVSESLRYNTDSR